MKIKTKAKSAERLNIDPANKVRNMFVTSPRYQSRPYVLHPGRREHIFGKVHAMDCHCGFCG